MIHHKEAGGNIMSAAFGSLIVIFFVLLVVAIAIGGTIFWIWMIIDCVTKEPSEGNEKIAWLLLLLLTHFVGAAIYYVVRRPQRIQTLGR